jgi:hypothetical protein
MNKTNARVTSICLGLLSSLIGIWFFLEERNYIIKNDSTSDSLAAKLQWVGIGIFLGGLAIMINGLADKD